RWRGDIRMHGLEVADKVTAGSSAVAAGSAESAADPAKLTAQIARRRAALEGSLALAALGQRWFGDPVFKDLVDLGDYRKTLDSVRALAVPDKDPGAWRTEATRQGSRIGRRVRDIAGEISRHPHQE